MKYCYEYGSFNINYDIVYNDRKNLKIIVNPNKEVVVEAPINTNLELISNKVKKRAKWIYKQINFFDEFHPLTPPREYESGETHYYLGKQYILKVKEDIKNSVELFDNNLIINVKYRDNRKLIKDIIYSWYLNQAKIIFQNKLKEIEEKLDRYNFKSNKLIIKKLETRWGSCSKFGTITLNTELIKAPMNCIKYVILHELCHIKYKNHNQKFFRMLESVMPDWKKWKDKLEKTLS